MVIVEQDVLRWLHILAMVYWLGGEWGVFHTSRFVIDPKLSLDERKRHMQTAYVIDILARTGIILLLPLGLHMGYNLGVQPLGGNWLAGMWALTAVWVGLCYAAFFKRGTDLGTRLTKADESIRYLLIPVLLFFGVWSLLGDGPLDANWYAAKASLYAVTLIIGLILRFIMREWTTMFRILDAEGSNTDVEAKLASSLKLGRTLAYFYWVIIASVAFLGATKPF